MCPWGDLHFGWLLEPCAFPRFPDRVASILDPGGILPNSAGIVFRRRRTPLSWEGPSEVIWTGGQKADILCSTRRNAFIFSCLFSRSQYSKTWDNKCLALIAWIRRFEVRVPFLSPKLWHFHQNIRLCAGNECCCPRTVSISNVDLTSKLSILTEPVFKNMGQQMSGSDSSNGSKEHSAWIRRLGVRPLQDSHFRSRHSKTLTLSQEHPFVYRKWMQFVHSLHFKC